MRKEKVVLILGTYKFHAKSNHWLFLLLIYSGKKQTIPAETVRTSSRVPRNCYARRRIKVHFKPIGDDWPSRHRCYQMQFVRPHHIPVLMEGKCIMGGLIYASLVIKKSAEVELKEWSSQQVTIHTTSDKASSAAALCASIQLTAQNKFWISSPECWLLLGNIVTMGCRSAQRQHSRYSTYLHFSWFQHAHSQDYTNTNN